MLIGLDFLKKLIIIYDLMMAVRGSTRCHIPVTGIAIIRLFNSILLEAVDPKIVNILELLL
jgi:hypothetical protein